MQESHNVRQKIHIANPYDWNKGKDDIDGNDDIDDD